MIKNNPWESQEMVLQKQREGSFEKVNETTACEKLSKMRIIMHFFLDL